MPAAAVASVPAALAAHALDASGRLPFVHETANVRGAMSPLAVALWLALTALLVGLAASSRRPTLVGAPAALASAGIPELIGRHDIGAVVEPSAMLGAVVQWLLLLVVVALAVVASRVLRTRPLLRWTPAAGRTFVAPYRARFAVQPFDWSRRPRGPPVVSFPRPLRRPGRTSMLFPPRRVVALALVTPVLATGLAACGGSSESSSAASTPCSGKLAAADPTAALPSGFPAPPGAVFYQLSTVGKTQVHFAYVKGTDEIAERDAIKAQLVQAGFKINGQDQEKGTEAELDADSAAHGGTLQVIHLCSGYLRLRFTLDH
ncbi:MAG: hypothetical protein QOD07_1376 [Frankiaceae bacterium]|nr:hypothetical protein [Frankiaceae bacterium]